MLLDEVIAARRLQIFAHHFADEFFESNLGRPTQLGLCLRWVAKQGFNLGWPKVAVIHADDYLARLQRCVARCAADQSLFVDALAAPVDRDSQFSCGGVDELPDTVLQAGG